MMKQTYDTVVLASKKAPQVVIFTAPWCGPCKMLKPSMVALQADYGFALTELDVTAFDSVQLETLGVRQVPCVRIIRDGIVTGQFSGARLKAHIKDWLTTFGVISDGLVFE
jgi:thioredoxin-like negative regulator of GroEL